MFYFQGDRMAERVLRVRERGRRERTLKIRREGKKYVLCTSPESGTLHILTDVYPHNNSMRMVLESGW